MICCLHHSFDRKLLLLFDAPFGSSVVPLPLLLSSVPASSGCSCPSGISALLTRATCGTINNNQRNSNAAECVA
jgi:hypothetical protein